MRLGFLIGLMLLFVSFFLSLLNLISGIQLSQSVGAPAEGHFIRALVSLGSAFASQVILLVSSQRWIEDLAGLASTTSEQLSQWRSGRNTVVPWVFAHFIACLTALITGTISYAGSFPIVHGLLGITLIAIAFWNFVLWIRFALRVTNS